RPLHHRAEEAPQGFAVLCGLPQENESIGDRLERGDVRALGLAPHASVDRRFARYEHQPVELEEPGVAPPESLRLRPGAVEHADSRETGRPANLAFRVI